MYRPRTRKPEGGSRAFDGLGGLSKKESAEIVDLVLETLKATLERGENIKLSGFGNLVVQNKKALMGSQPRYRRPDRGPSAAGAEVQGERGFQVRVQSLSGGRSSCASPALWHIVRRALVRPAAGDPP